MSKYNDELIARYLEGDLGREAVSGFEKALAGDPDLQEELNLWKKVSEISVPVQAFPGKQALLKKGMNFPWKSVSALAGSALLISCILFFLQQEKATTENKQVMISETRSKPVKVSPVAETDKTVELSDKPVSVKAASPAGEKPSVQPQGGVPETRPEPVPGLEPAYQARTDIPGDTVQPEPEKTVEVSVPPVEQVHPQKEVKEKKEKLPFRHRMRNLKQQLKHAWKHPAVVPVDR